MSAHLFDGFTLLRHIITANTVDLAQPIYGEKYTNQPSSFTIMTWGANRRNTIKKQKEVKGFLSKI